MEITRDESGGEERDKDAAVEPEMSREELKAALSRLDPAKVAEAVERAPVRWVVAKEPPR